MRSVVIVICTILPLWILSTKTAGWTLYKLFAHTRTYCRYIAEIFLSIILLEKCRYKEPIFVNVYGAQESIPRIRFHLPICSIPGRGTTNRVVVPPRQAGNRFLGSITRFTNTGSGWNMEATGRQPADCEDRCSQAICTHSPSSPHLHVTQQYLQILFFIGYL